MKWDATADQNLLLAILHTHRITVDHTRVSQLLGCTPRACEERLKKLRKSAKDSGYEFFVPPPTPSTPPSNNKRKRKASSGGRAEARQREKRKEGQGEGADGSGRVGRGGFVRTREGVEIPLGVPLEVSRTPVMVGGGSAEAWFWEGFEGGIEGVYGRGFVEEGEGF